MSEHQVSLNADLTMGRAIYILYLLSFVTVFTVFVGIVMAYIANPQGIHWLAEHYRFLRRTFWINCLYSVIGFGLLALGGGMLAMSGMLLGWLWILLGGIILILSTVWFIVRCIRGWQALEQHRPPRNPNHWLY